MIVAFSVSPMDTGDSIAPEVARAVRVVRDSGLPHETGPMFTSVEGEWDEVMDVVKRAVQAAGEGSSRLSLTLKADFHEGGTHGLRQRVEAVEHELGNA